MKTGCKQIGSKIKSGNYLSQEILPPTHFKQYGHLIFKKILNGGKNSPKQGTLRGDAIPRHAVPSLPTKFKITMIS